MRVTELRYQAFQQHDRWEVADEVRWRRHDEDEDDAVAQVESFGRVQKRIRDTCLRGGTQRMQFSSTTAGTATLTLEYRRPWEKNTPPAKTYRATVVIK